MIYGLSYFICVYKFALEWMLLFSTVYNVYRLHLILQLDNKIEQSPSKVFASNGFHLFSLTLSISRICSFVRKLLYFIVVAENSCNFSLSMRQSETRAINQQPTEMVIYFFYHQQKMDFVRYFFSYVCWFWTRAVILFRVQINLSTQSSSIHNFWE